jgi:hypothetical protein
MYAVFMGLIMLLVGRVLKSKGRPVNNLEMKWIEIRRPGFLY